MEKAHITVRKPPMGGLLRLVYETMRARVYERMADAGFPDIRPAHSVLLRKMAEGCSRVSEMAERAQMTKQSMGYLADTLAAAGYVTLEPDTTDRRAKLVSLTEKGRAAEETMIRLSAETEREFASLIGEEEMAQLRCLLEKLSEKLGGIF